MRKAYIVVALGIAVAIVIVGISRAKFLKSKPMDEMSGMPMIDAMSEQLARGDYLANHVALCLDCHTDRDFTYFSGPVVHGTEGKGGTPFGADMALRGTFFAKNITPAAISDWTDADLVKALTQGINKKGEVLFPVMPYLNYRHLTQEDLGAIIAFIRTLKPIQYEVPAREPVAPIEVLVPQSPPPLAAMPTVDRSNSVEYGKYLTTVASCSDCHTPMENGRPIAGMEFAGGYPFELPGGQVVISQNITPDVETGIGKWDRQTFITIFKAYSEAEVHRAPLAEGENNTIMPWSAYSGMTEEDLGAIYDYLRTLKPVSNKVERFIEREM
jgi:mono/diheme cytochrome c family protein